MSPRRASSSALSPRSALGSCSSVRGSCFALLDRRLSVMAIDRSVVEKAAALARIALTPEEVERFTGQLSVVLRAVERLKDVDTEKVSPTASVLPVLDVMREDEARPGLTVDEALANAPRGGRDGEFFRVQQVLEERP